MEQGIVQKILKKYRIKVYEKHNYGVVPSVFFPNLPIKNFFGSMIME
jgi:hypothetical protein